MTFEEAKTFLSQFVREESKDQIWNDKEVYWYHPSGDKIGMDEMANGFTDGKFFEVVIQNNTTFVGDDARALMKCGVFTGLSYSNKEFEDTEDYRLKRIEVAKPEVVFK